MWQQSSLQSAWRFSITNSLARVWIYSVFRFSHSFQIWPRMQVVPDFWRIDWWSFNYMMVWKWYAFGWKLYFEFWCSSGLVIRPTKLSWYPAVAAVGLFTHGGELPVHLWWLCAHMAVLCSLSAPYSVNYTKYSTLDHQIGLVLEDFAGCRLMEAFWAFWAHWR